MKKIIVILFVLFLSIGNLFAQDEVPLEHESEKYPQTGIQKSPGQLQLPDIILGVYDNVTKTFKFHGSFFYQITYNIYNDGVVLQSGICNEVNSCVYCIDMSTIPSCNVCIEIIIQGVSYRSPLLTI